MKVLQKAAIHQLYWAAHKANLFPKSSNAQYFYDFDCLLDRLGILKQYFPKGVLHAVAIKTQSNSAVLQKIVDNGMGLEAASIEEVHLALATGIEASKIVFDSPVKTREEIDFCHHQLAGIYVNANSLEELKRYPPDFSGRLGLRINPLVRSDAPSIFDVAQKRSKFGVPIDQEAAIIQASIDYPIKGLHLHIGSGIRNFSGNIEAIGRVLKLAYKINQLRPDNPLEFLDIGGGIDFEAATGSTFSVASFVDVLIKQYPTMFEDFQLITEFGKFVHKHNAFAVSTIEYVTPPQQASEAGTAFIHIGADLFLRKVYSKLSINYPCSVHCPQKKPSSSTLKYNIAGPLCFAGDFLYYDLVLPKLQSGDLFFMHQVGANTLSLWSNHCSRTAPYFVGFYASRLISSLT